MNRNTKLLCLVTCVAVVGLYFAMSGRGATPAANHNPTTTLSDSAGPERSSQRDRASTEEPSGRLAPDDTSAFDDLSVGQLFAGLLEAASAGDHLATTRIRGLLRSRPTAEVTETAFDFLAIERDRNAHLSASTKSQQVSATNRMSNILFFLVESHPDAGLSLLRQRWSTPLVMPLRKEAWLELERKPADLHASRLLDDLDRIESASLANVISHDLAEGGKTCLPMLQLIGHLYHAAPLESEIPDPWLSGILSELKLNTRQHDSGEPFDPVRSWIAEARDNPHYSLRLRIQAAALISASAKGIWDLLDKLSASLGIEDAAMTLRNYIQGQGLTAEDVRLLVAHFHKQYGSDPGAYWRLMPTAVGSTTDAIVIARWRDVANALLSTAGAASDEGEAIAAISMLSAMRMTWGHRLLKHARQHMLDSSSGMTLQQCVTLYNRLLGESGRPARSATATAAGRVYEFIWITDSSIDSKLDTVVAMLETARSINYTTFVAVANGLEKSLEDIHPGHHTQVGKIVGSVLERVDLQRYMTPESSHPVKLNSAEAIFLRQLGGALRAAGWPAIGDIARSKLIRFSTLVRQAIESQPTPVQSSTALGELATSVLNEYSTK